MDNLVIRDGHRVLPVPVQHGPPPENVPGLEPTTPDQAMLCAVQGGLDDRRYALISLAITGLTGCERFADALRGPLDLDTARRVAEEALCGPQCRGAGGLGLH